MTHLRLWLRAHWPHHTKAEPELLAEAIDCVIGWTTDTDGEW